MSTSADTPRFQFVPNIPREEYRQFWQERTKKAREKFASLEEIRQAIDINRYLNELNDFDFLLHGEVRGEFFNEFHPDADFRQEAKAAKMAIISLESEVYSSTAIAENLASAESTGLMSDCLSKRYLYQWKRDLKRGGAYLSAQGKEEVIRLSQKIQEAEDRYIDGIRNDENELELGVEQLRGVPDDFFASHSVDLTTGKIILGHKGADTGPVLQYCGIQDTREKVAKYVNSTATAVNGPVLQRLLKVRADKARILGYNNWADYQLENAMVKSSGNVAAFLEEVHEAVKAGAESEKQQIAKLLKEEDGIEDAQSWDMKYGTFLLKSHLLHGFDPKDARQYFKTSRVLPALLRIVEKLFELRFEETENVEAWHASVTASHVYDVSEGKKTLVGRLFFDLYPRKGKLDGASAWTLRGLVPGKQLAEVVLEANMPEHPSACLSYLEVQTLLHELGHCAHDLVAPNRYVRFAGMGLTQWDFVEAPSQMLELWLTDYQLFDFAVNDKGEVIPKHVLDQLIAAEGVARAMNLRSQLVLAKYALDMHTTDVEDEDQIFKVVAAAQRAYGSFPLSDKQMSMHLSFWHLGSASYNSGYYCYLFAEVICHDIFEEFKRTGNIMDRNVATRYRKLVLAKVGSQDADEVVTEFLGRQYNSKAFQAWLNAGIQDEGRKKNSKACRSSNLISHPDLIRRPLQKTKIFFFRPPRSV